jgi:hypothetical protein
MILKKLVLLFLLCCLGKDSGLNNIFLSKKENTDTCKFCGVIFDFDVRPARIYRRGS